MKGERREMEKDLFAMNFFLGSQLGVISSFYILSLSLFPEILLSILLSVPNMIYTWAFILFPLEMGF